MTMIKTGFLLIFSVLLSASAQICLKLGTSTPNTRAALDQGPIDALLAFAREPFIILGLIAFGTSVISWLFVLSRMPVSLAYPVVALGIVFTSAAGYFFLEEPINRMHAIGISLILIGLITLAFS